MKKIILYVCFLCYLTSTALGQTSNSVQNYLANGLYQFNDTWKIQKSEIFTTYLSQFGFTTNNSLTLINEGLMDTVGGESDQYVQYCNGYQVQGTLMNVISKYGVVLFVDGFTIPYLNTNVSNSVSESNALSTALSYIGADNMLGRIPV